MINAGSSERNLPGRPNGAGRPDPVFHIRGITKTYRMGDVDIHALRGVDLELFPGEFVVLLVPSGSGKSTLLNILGGLDVPTSGQVWYLDHNLTEAKAPVLSDTSDRGSP